MKRKIFKYTLDWDVSAQTINLPRGSKVLTVDEDGRGLPCVWAEVDDPSEFIEPVTFDLVLTGNDVSSNSTYIATRVRNDGIVWHAYLLN